MIGKKSITQKERDVLIGLAKNTCEQCRKKDPECGLDIHRILRGEHGGTYVGRNVKVLCNICHKLLT